MHVIVNALSVTNLSARHVLMGHLRQISAWARAEHDFTVIHHRDNADIVCDLGRNVRWHECPPATARWAPRLAWETAVLPQLCRKLGAELLWLPNGITVAGLAVPQVTLAQNPWALVPGLPMSKAERIKAAVQRSSYRTAMKRADLMLFNSEYMRGAYRKNAGFHERAGVVAYQGLSESLFDTAESTRVGARRNPGEILCVAVFAPHKRVEILVAALARLRCEHQVPATLKLVGPWPHTEYLQQVREAISSHDLVESVEITSYVDTARLHAHYASAQVFCVLSLCESFGIPAVEAQAFGTPTVSTECCAIPEVSGAGGVYVPVDDAGAAAAALARVIGDDALWRQKSEAAIANAARFHWSECSRPLLKMFEVGAAPARG